MDLVHYISKLQTNVFLIRNDDDLADRLNYRYTVAILVAFAIIVSHRQFSESVIKCWVPAFFTPNYEAYANQVCWVSNTYYVNQTQNVPSDDKRKSSEIKYYQWIPFILLIQALFLYIPRILWRLLSARAGLDMRDLIEAAHSYKSVEKFTNKRKVMEYIVQNIDQYASNPRRSKARDSVFQKVLYFSESLFCGSGIYLGNYLVTTYFFIKLVYLFNSIVQFFVMNEFLGKQFHELGLDILRYLTNTYSLENSIESVYFPKVVMCDFKIREFGHPNFSHRYTIQCVLPINLYNQQIFTFLWFWFLLLFFANCWALAQWINRMLPQSRRRYIKRRLNMLKYFQNLNETTSIISKPKGIFRRRKSVSLESKRQRRLFIDDYLKFDGVFIIRMISMLTSEIVGTELLHELWKKRAVYKNLRGDEPEPDSAYGAAQFNNYNNYTDDFKKSPYPPAPPPPQPPPSGVGFIPDMDRQHHNENGYFASGDQTYPNVEFMKKSAGGGDDVEADGMTNEINEMPNRNVDFVPEHPPLASMGRRRIESLRLRQSFDSMNQQLLPNRISRQRIKRKTESGNVDSTPVGQQQGPPLPSQAMNQNGAVASNLPANMMGEMVADRGSNSSFKQSHSILSATRNSSIDSNASKNISLRHPKKVAFASNLNTDDLEIRNDFDDVFSDLKFDA